MKKLLALLIGSSALAASSVSAQTSKGILAGVARDATSAVVTQATITITNEETGEVRTSLTQGDGAYRIEAITPGHYTVAVEHTGFNREIAKGVIVNPSVVNSYDATLKIGDVSNAVEVSATSNAINTENGQLAGIIGATEIRNLPVFSLNPIELATTLPGVQIVNQGGTGGQGQEFSSNGARPRANNFLIDGQEINDVSITGQAFQPNLTDTYNDVAVLTNSASAEYGRGGGAITNLITRGGTNIFHGSAYERYTGSGLNALTPLQRQQKATATAANPVRKTRFDTHTYGFTGGGPILKDKLFVFGAGQWQRTYGQALGGRFELPDGAGVATLRSIAAAQGPNGQAALFGRYLSDYAYLTAYQNVRPNLESINVGAQQGCPGSGSCSISTAFFQRPSVPQQSTNTQWTYRVDWTPRQQDSLGFRYLHSRNRLSPDFGNNLSLTGFDSQQGGPVELGEGFWTHVFGPNVLNEFRVSEARLSFAFDLTPETLANPLNSLPAISLLGNQIPVLGPNTNLPQGRGEDLYQFQDTVGFTKGRHSVRVGADVGRQLEQELISLNTAGTLTYGSTGTFGSSVGEFLSNNLGGGGSATRTFGSTRIDPHGWRSGVFAQDDIKLNPDLTMNFGVRYDYLTQSENSLRFPGVDPATLATDPIDRVIRVNPDTNNISPRIGFAYVPHVGFFSNGKTVFHGGFGTFYDSSFSNFVVNAGQVSPNAVAGQVTSIVSAATPNGVGNSSAQLATLSPILRPTNSVTSVDRNIVNPYTYQYNLGFERELPGNTKFTLNYVGASAKKLFVSRQYNYVVPGTSARVIPTRGPILVRGSYGASNYNSLQAELSHSAGHGISFRAAYTYSHDLDNNSEAFATNQGGSLPADLSSTGLRQDYGNSVFDHRNYLVISYVYAPVGLRSSNGLLDAAYGVLTRHWTITGIERFQSGPYSNFFVGADTNGDGTSNNDRPIVSNPSAPLNTAAVDGGSLIGGGLTNVTYDLVAYNNSPSTARVRTPLSPTNAHFYIPNGANAIRLLNQQIGRNAFLNPGQQFHDLVVQKGIGLSYLHFERGTLNLRAEAQNIGNHNNVGVLGTNVLQIGTPSVFNTVTARTGTPAAGRTLVLWAKLIF